MSELVKIGQEYYVPATSALADSSRRVLKHGDTFAVFNRQGDIQPLGLGEQGLFHEGTRFLSRYELTMDGQRPLVLSSFVHEDNLIFGVDLTNPDLKRKESLLRRGEVHLFRSKLLYKGICYEMLRIQHFGLISFDFRLEFALDSDFADIFEVRGISREKRGEYLGPAFNEGSFELGYVGLDSIRRTTRVLLNKVPDHVEENTFTYDMHLKPGQCLELEIAILCDVQENERIEYIPRNEACRKAKEEDQDISAGEPHLETSSELFTSFLTRSRSDLRMLMTQMDGSYYPYAGIPWFSTPFGRDGLITAMECLWLSPSNAKGVLQFLAKTQAEEESDMRDSEPGKILHEARKGEMANTGEVPYKFYYGSIDSTPLFVLLAGKYLRRTGDLDFVRDLQPHLDRALDWIDVYGDCDGDGFVEYRKRSERGLRNQGWKDSEDSVFHADGALAEGDIALCEVQAYVYGAYMEAAFLAEIMGRRGEAMRRKAQAHEFRRKFEQTFWDDRLGMYVVALDGKKRPCRVKSSNAGHCLLTNIALPERARRIEEQLLSPAFHSGWGIRTIPADEPRYNPMSYHNGSIWPHDNALIAMGLSRYGLKRLPLTILENMFDVSLEVDEQRLPELFCGFHRRQGEGPTLYPVACAPQAWASAASFYLLQACLGLSVNALNRVVSFYNPALPNSINEMSIRNLRVGQANVDLLIIRAGSDISVHLDRKDGDVQIHIIK